MITDNDFDIDKLTDGVLDFLAAMEIEDQDAVVSVAIDMTLAYVVDWLSSTGAKAKGEILDGLTDR